MVVAWVEPAIGGFVGSGRPGLMLGATRRPKARVVDVENGCHLCRAFALPAEAFDDVAMFGLALGRPSSALAAGDRQHRIELKVPLFIA